MGKRDSFLLRIDPAILDALRRWSDDEMRSINAQIEFLLRQSLKQAGRVPKAQPSTPKTASDPSSTPEPENPAVETPDAD